MKNKWLLLWGLLLPLCLQAQQYTNSGDVIMFKFEYGATIKGGDMADRFGWGFRLGGGAEWLTKKNNWRRD